MPHGFKYPPSGRLAQYLKHRGSDPSWGNLPGLHGVCRSLPPRDILGILSNARGRNSTGLAPTALIPSGQGSPGGRPGVGTRLPPTPQTCIIGKKQPRVNGRADTPGTAGWEAAQAGTVAGILTPQRTGARLMDGTDPSRGPFSDLPAALCRGHLPPCTP